MAVFLKVKYSENFLTAKFHLAQQTTYKAIVAYNYEISIVLHYTDLIIIPPSCLSHMGYVHAQQSCIGLHMVKVGSVPLYNQSHHNAVNLILHNHIQVYLLQSLLKTSSLYVLALPKGLSQNMCIILSIIYILICLSTHMCSMIVMQLSDIYIPIYMLLSLLLSLSA